MATRNRSTSFVFTVNNYSLEDIEVLKRESWEFENEVELGRGKVRRSLVKVERSYIVFGEELGEETHTPHLQGYLELSKRAEFNTLRKCFHSLISSPPHIEVARGSAKQNKEYCSKQARNVVELGVPHQQGRRSDLEVIADDIKQATDEGQVFNSIVEAPSLVARYPKFEAALQVEFGLTRSWKTELIWVYGNSRTGKSYYANEQAHERAFRKLTSSRFWDGYNPQSISHEDAIIDDFSPAHLDTVEKFKDFLRIADRYAVNVEIKGAMKPFLVRRLFVTSVEPPWKFVPFGEQPLQLFGRIDRLVQFTDYMVKTELTSRQAIDALLMSKHEAARSFGY